MIDPTTEFGARVEKRLLEEQVIWLTTVSPSGIPQPNPVWFYWDGDTVLIYSQPDAYKIKNLINNPKVSLNFEGATQQGGDVIILTGEAVMEENVSKIDLAYEEKYHQAIIDFDETPEDLFISYSVAIRVRLEKVRGF